MKKAHPVLKDALPWKMRKNTFIIRQGGIRTQYLTRANVAELLQISEHAAGTLMNDMRCLILPGGRKRVSESDLQVWIESHTKCQKEKPLKVMRRDSSLFDEKGRIRRKAC